jgi:hypothetical protein
MEDNEGGNGSLYQPLYTIRLLRFKASNDCSKFGGDLEIFPLSSCPPFVALSYTWVPESYSHLMNINGYDVKILDSLYPFVKLLPSLPEFSPDTWWWIDSICINQKDEQEKSSQIQLMGKIWERAEKTIVWLGKEVDKNFSEESRDCTRAISTLHRLEKKRWEFTRDDGSLDRAEFRQLRDPKWGMDWTSVERFLLRPWWRRVWTLQEFLIGDKVMFYCGKRSISQSSFHVAMYALWSLGASDGMLINTKAYKAGWNRRRMNQWYGKRKEEMGLVAMIAYMGDCGVTDERDRVYSLLGVARDADMVGNIDPTDNVDKVYTKLVRCFVSRYDSLDIICFSHLFNAFAPRSRIGTALPSWVPDWRAQIGTKVIPVMASQGSRKSIGNFRPPAIIEATAIYAASGDHAPRVKISKDLRILTCEGVILDIVDGLGGTKYNDQGERFNDVEMHERPLIQSVSTTNCLEEGATDGDFDLMGCVSRCLVLDREDRYLGNNMPHDFFRTDFVAFCNAALKTPQIVHPLFLEWFEMNKSLRMQGRTIKECCKHAKPLKIQADFESLANDKGFLSRFRDTAVEMARRLIITGRGYVGMAPSRAAKGDIVCVLFGCSIPVLLREIDRGSYAFIGEVYLDGFMNGEGLHRASGKTERRFCLM